MINAAMIDNTMVRNLADWDCKFFVAVQTQHEHITYMSIHGCGQLHLSSNV